jgi:arylsulfatase
VEELDWSVGQVFQALRENGLDQQTLVFFTSDNGPWYQGSPGKLRGRKDTTYEGGVREPFLARFPGRIPQGKICDGLTSMLDLFPTVARLSEASLPPKPLDGIDVWPMLTGQVSSIDRAPLLYFNTWDLQCARWNNWKLHIARHNTAAYVPAPPGGIHNYVLPHPELYNLEKDPDESYDVAATNRAVVNKIEGQINGMIRTFPQEVRQAYSESVARKVNPDMPAGSYPKAVH